MACPNQAERPCAKGSGTVTRTILLLSAGLNLHQHDGHTCQRGCHSWVAGRAVTMAGQICTRTMDGYVRGGRPGLDLPKTEMVDNENVMRMIMLVLQGLCCDRCGGRTMKALLLIVLFLLSLACASPVSASDTFRCGPEIVTRGETTIETLISCGEPSFREILNPGFEGSRVENWFYNCGSGSFLHVLRFVEGRLQDVKTEGYGRGQSDCIGALHR